MIRISLFLGLLIFGLPTVLPAQFFLKGEPLTSTYSIVARDMETGEMGVAVQSHWFSVGTIVNWGEAGVGVVATQSIANPSFGPNGLSLLKDGLQARQVLDSLLAMDAGRDLRQLAILDNRGNVAVHTGSRCIAEAGHVKGDQYSVQANLMEKKTVWDAMAQAFEGSKGQPLAERLIIAMEAAQEEGGDIRGMQSAALLVVRAEPSGMSWIDRKVDLRVDDSDKPLAELRRLWTVHQAYEYMNEGDKAIEEGNFQRAMENYVDAKQLLPENPEVRFWSGVTLINNGKWDEGKAILQEIFREDKEDRWTRLIPRIRENGFLEITEKEMMDLLQK